MSSDTRQSRPRYWCHICNAEVPIYMAPDPTCQQCNEQFIEELHSDDDPREFLAGADQHNASTTTTAAGNEDTRMPSGSAHFFSYSPSTGRINNLGGSGSGGNNNGEMGDDIFQYFTPPPPPPPRNNTAEDGRERPPTSDGTPSPLGNFVQNLLTNMLGQNVDITTTIQSNDGEGNGGGVDGNGQDGRPMVFFGNMVDGNVRLQPIPAGQAMPGGMPNLAAAAAAAAAANANAGERNEDGGNTNPGTENNNNNNNEDPRGNNIASLLQFLSAMTGGAIDGGLVGNPNDYVFSQNALDNIITQLMEQTGGASAPPPAPEQVIESLQKRSLTDQEKSQEADCAVCKDQFELQEQVIELPCEHIFHDECIKPWLKLNSTCPVCRHSVLPDQQEQEQGQDNNNNNNNGNSNGPDDNTQSNATQGDTNRSAADDDNNNDNNNNNNDNGNGGHTSVSGFTWIGSGTAGGNNNGNAGGGNNGQQLPSSWPLNLSAAFPWVEGLARQANNINNNHNTNTTSPHSSSPNPNNTTNQNSNSTHIDEDLDLD